MSTTKIKRLRYAAAVTSLVAATVSMTPTRLAAAETSLAACQALAGTYVTTVTDVEGVFSSRGLLTFSADGIFLMSDSAQAGLPGVYDPFESAQGSWRCLGVKGKALGATAVGLNFVLPGDGRTAVFGRVDYRLTLDMESGVLSGSAALSFTPDGDLEGADPIARPGPVFERFDVEGKRVVSRK